MHPKMRSNLASRRQASPSTSCKFGERCMGVPVHRDDAVQCPVSTRRLPCTPRHVPRFCWLLWLLALHQLILLTISTQHSAGALLSHRYRWLVAHGFGSSCLREMHKFPERCFGPWRQWGMARVEPTPVGRGVEKRILTRRPCPQGWHPFLASNLIKDLRVQQFFF